MVGVLEDEGLKLSGQPIALVENALVVNGARSTLDGHVRAEVEVELKGVSTSGLNQSTRQRVAVTVTLAGIGEEADVVAFAGDDDRELGIGLAAKLLEARLHITDFLFQNGCPQS